jgi:hypothetical protein
MIGYNYHRPVIGRIFGSTATLQLARALRTGVPGFALACALAGGIWGFELRVLGGIENDLASVQAGLSADEADDRRLRQAKSAGDTMQALLAALDRQKRSTAQELNALAAIGNALPPNTWLTELHRQTAGTWSMAGRSARLEEIGDTLVALQRLDATGDPRLISVSSKDAGVPLAFTAEWTTTR